MTIALYARQQKWPLESVVVRLRHSRIHAKDCADCMTKTDTRIDRIEADIELTGSLTADQRGKLMEVGGKCPVHRTLTSEIDIRTRAVPPP